MSNSYTEEELSEQEQYREIKIYPNYNFNYPFAEPPTNYSVNFTLSNVARVISIANYDNYDSSISNDENTVMNTQDIINKSATLVFDPNNGITWFNIDFCLEHYLHLDLNVREEVKELLSKRVNEYPQPESLIVSIDYVTEYYQPLYDNAQQEDSEKERKRLAKELKIAALKRVKVEDIMGKDDKEYVCSICLKDMAKEIDEIVIPLPCKHAFHGDCILTWLKTYSSTCPVCRFDFGSESSC